ncbi:efflux RND transporter periplasmic adaptor subunit [Roseimaritima ulvae]|uniref:Efflux system component YknX n=1 Tax=Roseimaritima ulvae TaxID=980254 RepID=A0A5B9QTV0_9BACT|nr:HlyD family efflux transporter periplasmic adaptor subunit [Roseimaritima ulvae]QEG41180.1 Putative efflux system component YknX [Roseimaritima ulvae]
MAKHQIRNLVYWLLAVVVVGVVVVLAVKPRPVLVDIAVAARGAMDVRIEEDGKTRIRERYMVSSPLTGRLLRVTWDVGDAVVGGETILARLEPTDPDLLDPRTIAQARARVRAAERKLEATKAALAKAEAAADFAEVEMGRARQLRRTNAASISEFEEKELAFRQRSEDARAAGFNVDIAEYELELQRAALLLSDPDQTDDGDMELSIRAPIDGRVLRIYQESTAVVAAGVALMELGDPTDLEVVADFLSRDAVRISAGDRVIMRHWGGLRPLEGRVRLVEPSGFTKVSALGVEEQRVNVIIDLVDPSEQRAELGDGFRVDCEVVVWEDTDVLQIPTSALFRVDGNWHVFAIEANTARLRPVEIDHNNGTVAEIIEGLEEGAQVIPHPSDTIEDGVLVEQR